MSWFYAHSTRYYLSLDQPPPCRWASKEERGASCPWFKDCTMNLIGYYYEASADTCELLVASPALSLGVNPFQSFQVYTFLLYNDTDESAVMTQAWEDSSIPQPGILKICWTSFPSPLSSWDNGNCDCTPLEDTRLGKGSLGHYLGFHH